MTQVLDDLVALLSLEKIEENLFRGGSQDLGFRQLFGGQVLGQAAHHALPLDRLRHEQRAGQHGPVVVAGLLFMERWTAP